MSDHPIRRAWLTIENDETYEKWAIPVAVIAKNRATYYAENDDEFGGSYERSLNEDTWPLFESDEFEVTDWARNNMNWSDVEDHARLLEAPEPQDMQDLWVSGDSEVRTIEDHEWPEVVSV